MPPDAPWGCERNNPLAVTAPGGHVEAVGALVLDPPGDLEAGALGDLEGEGVAAADLGPVVLPYGGDGLIEVGWLVERGRPGPAQSSDRLMCVSGRYISGQASTARRQRSL
jgi:hypothetical protein